MKTYVVSYFVVGKTITEGQWPYTIAVDIDADFHLKHGWANVFFAVVCRAVELLRAKYPHDQWVFVGVFEKSHIRSNEQDMSVQ